MKTFKEARGLLSRQNFTVIGVRSPAGGKERREAAERVQELGQDSTPAADSSAGCHFQCRIALARRKEEEIQTGEGDSGVANNAFYP